jgi:glycosyltransferase involved in cell wall biosynthesis
MDTGAKETLKRDLGIAPDQKVVSLVARLVRSKGIKLYWNAAHAVRESGTNACFLLIGPQDHESMDGLSLEEIDSMSQDIYWLGYRSDIENIFAISDVFVLPSGREGLPRVLAEAAAAGLPLIASNVPGCSEVVEDGVNGFLFAPGGGEDLIDAIKFLLNNETLRRSYGEASRRIALERLDIEVISKSISELYAKRKNHRVRDHVTRSDD